MTTSRFFSEADVILFQRKVGEFASRELPNLIRWTKELKGENPPAILTEKGKNDPRDLPDGSWELSVGARQVTLELELHRKHLKSNFSYPIRKRGSFIGVLSFIGRIPFNEQLQALMAFYVESRGERLCNSPEWRDLSEHFRLSETLDCPFYKGACEAILDKFRDEGLIHPA